MKSQLDAGLISEPSHCDDGPRQAQVFRLKILFAFLGACTVGLFVGVGGPFVQQVVTSSLPARCVEAHPPLNGRTRSLWASNYRNSKEHLQFDGRGIVVDWRMSEGKYTFEAPETLGRPQDHGVEHGFCQYLVGPVYSISDKPYEWTSRAFVASRVVSANHTSCCCQYMHGSGSTFRLSEFCRALVPGVTASLEATCAPYAEPPCPKDNETASQMAWTVPMYVEVYDKCYM
eukprot:TRINITY_DN10390_c0_g1_i4.p1 TRINITY_DN10390_c0_g1~~TRINITY_DN10390_c0_g1_i4.p1  ORF type:complete len:231 (-),score=20.51 TRINITY_DN10390_c0_g1_i4:196-888(-)